MPVHQPAPPSSLARSGGAASPTIHAKTDSTVTRVINFSAGPAALPLPVLQRVREELLDWNSTGASVMEISHRSKKFIDLAERSEADLRDLLSIPKEYAVLFLQGGAQTQFSMVPLNLLQQNAKADYIDSGYWSQLAIREAERYGRINIAASSKDEDYMTVPPQNCWQLDPEASYVHYTPNETITGVEFHWVPETKNVPLVADMSSTILSRPVDVAKFGLIYAGAQKNVGPSGITVVIVHRELFGQTAPSAPRLFSYEQQASAGSMMNTVPTFNWYVVSLVLQWLKQQGGVDGIAVINQRKAHKLYSCIDCSAGFYRNRVAVDCRSWMNVTFDLNDPRLEEMFIEQTEREGMIGLRGHRVAGGVRASLYNAVSEEGVDALVAFMQDFETRYG